MGTIHVAVDLRYALLHPDIFYEGERQLTKQEVQEYVDECKAKGYRVIPPSCGNINPDGTCAGHYEDDEDRPAKLKPGEGII